MPLPPEMWDAYEQELKAYEQAVQDYERLKAERETEDAANETIARPKSNRLKDALGACRAAAGDNLDKEDVALLERLGASAEAADAFAVFDAADAAHIVGRCIV